ncbi:DUF456 domain-containing protein [Verrucomicrobia bacterium S94]|nr:DUF456 domain-containing protein [Verrucomicrobia bacterium S94]
MEFDWQALGSVGIYSFAALLCFSAFILSCLSLSGTWLVLAAAGLISWYRWPEFPNVGTLILFTLLCVGVEVAEAFAGTWGVQKRGGSKRAGIAAAMGGFSGLFLGGLIPLPIIGNLLGMLIGSFIFAFLVEQNRLKKTEQAAHIATGAVFARLAVIFLKIGMTVLMSLLLAIGVAITS